MTGLAFALSGSRFVFLNVIHAHRGSPCRRPRAEPVRRLLHQRLIAEQILQRPARSPVEGVRVEVDSAAAVGGNHRRQPTGGGPSDRSRATTASSVSACLITPRGFSRVSTTIRCAAPRPDFRVDTPRACTKGLDLP